MSEPSSFRGVIDFFVEIGLYDVVLPFLLVFTIVFAVLDKTRVFGSDKIGGELYPKKNVNAMVAFVIAFFIVASSQIVQLITTISSQVVVLLMASVFFLILVGSFMKETEDGVFLDDTWKTVFMIIMFIGLVLIFLNALGWIQTIYDFLRKHWSSDIVSSVILLGLIAGVIAFVYGSRGNGSNNNSKNE
jgi:hypothetical protein